MCGICGMVYRDRQKPVDGDALQRMNDAMRHRGPDDAGYHLAEGVGLAMRRLSIIDLVSGSQPIYNEDRSLAIVFNGEIYNHAELRTQLIARGHNYRTRTDTETILHAYEEYGEECPRKLNGMFAFAIWDSRKELLFVARDRIGIKPLYYYQDGEQLIFASELKSILQQRDVPRNIDRKSLDTFLTFEYIPRSYSIFQDIHKLLPAHYLIYERGKITIRPYWHLSFQASEESEGQLAEQFVALLTDAVKIRLMSDVPLGAFLSGGLDSSSVVALMSRSSNNGVKTFSIGFADKTYNELPYARRVAQVFATEHHEEFINPDIVDLTAKLIHHLDEPLGDFSIFPTFLVSEMARRHVKVVLSGDGGDELFAGYDTYIADRLARKFSCLPRFLRTNCLAAIAGQLRPSEKKKGLRNRIKRFAEGARLPADLQHVRWMIFLQNAEKQRLYSSDFLRDLGDFDAHDLMLEQFASCNSNDPLDQQQYVDIHTYLVDDILVKVDRMSMATSLEARVPFLDYRFVEFAATVPSHLRLRGKTSKYLLKRAMTDILPIEIIQRNKEGFSIPIKNWMKKELKPMMLDALSPASIKKSGFFDSNTVQSLIHEHLQGRENHSHRLWALMVFQLWWQQTLQS
ncbi:MAG TPA: asparagine synthase (glutamine-hydrolyzing) [bacterium]|nr:asparagine synthase (glutamine-hydrolyzing) [bacterium]HPG45811.1 asparagine synthase (glutamine-hydrolyzing) [bacterium]HPM97962.1 asparagine synthase (glutamine-hydrolyzing) [bacterium]